MRRNQTGKGQWSDRCCHQSTQQGDQYQHQQSGTAGMQSAGLGKCSADGYQRQTAAECQYDNSQSGNHGCKKYTLLSADTIGGTGQPQQYPVITQCPLRQKELHKGFQSRRQRNPGKD